MLFTALNNPIRWIQPVSAFNKLKAQREQAICPNSHSWWVVETGLKPSVLYHWVILSFILATQSFDIAREERGKEGQDGF